MIKKIVFLALLLFPTFAFAGSCPLLMKEIDQILEETKQLSKEQLNEIRQLRIQGEEAHKSGDHEESEKLLKEALQLLDS